MKVYVPFYYQKTGRIAVEADSAEEAYEKAEEVLEAMSWSELEECSERVFDSAVINKEGIILDEDQNIVFDN